jgi:hypothetical protein
MKTKLAVMESKWFERDNTSVRGLFDLLGNIHHGNPNSYHYEMFNDSNAFKEIFARLATTDNIHNLYFACHGNEGGIVGSNGETISLTVIKNAIDKADDSRGRLHSVYFGSCCFGNEKSLETVMSYSNKLHWAAGYEKTIDFIESSALDMMFWNRYLSSNENTPLQKVKETVETLKQDANNLITRLGFHVYAGKTAFIKLI